MCIFLLSVIIGEIHKKGSGIEQVALPNQYHFSQSVFSEFMNMVFDKANFNMRNFINNLAESTPPPPLPIAPPTLYDLTQTKQQRLSFEVEEKEGKKFFIKSQIPDLKDLKTINPKDFMDKNLNNENSDIITANLRIESNQKTLKDTVIRKSYNDKSLSDNQRICNHCKEVYTYRHHKQKYCKDDCRIKAWEERTGKQLKMKKKK